MWVPRRIFDQLAPFALDLQSLLQIKCLSDFSFYTVWTVRTLVVPAVLAAAIYVLFVWEKRSIDDKVAAERARGNLFVLVRT